jgi:hypothetical protein
VIPLHGDLGMDRKCVQTCVERAQNQGKRPKIERANASAIWQITVCLFIEILKSVIILQTAVTVGGTNVKHNKDTEFARLNPIVVFRLTDDYRDI